ncbi:VWA domain-containing protein [Prosthecochloris vibrioformis]|uniref:VWA domain-containing protein n=1 Tax=Prosthecochloris vibrioformis TaxID=1098 RepID=A0A5C4S350_PROVB|nr:VWA domain-containing protein [Prosthecochloris vibrioformis]TNJ37765.1 VWA domain-containing protein [Prosthecochloris vibrioformis]
MMLYGFLLFIPPVRLAEPWWLLLFVPVLLFCLYRVPGRRYRLLLPGSGLLAGKGIGAGLPLVAAETMLLASSGLAAIVAMAGPEVNVARDAVPAPPGADVMLVIDASASMLQENEEGVSRFDLCREVALSWTEARHGGRTGLVLFRGDPFLISPLTGDHAVLADILRGIEPGGITREGTAAGSAIMFALRRLGISGSPQRFIMLFSDGEYNLGPLAPERAVAVAHAEGVVISALIPLAAGSVSQWLEEAARLTGGKSIRLGGASGRGVDPGMLPGGAGYHGTWFKLYPGSSLSPVFLVLALSLLVLAIVLGNTRLLKVP